MGSCVHKKIIQQPNYNRMRNGQNKSEMDGIDGSNNTSDK